MKGPVIYYPIQEMYGSNLSNKASSCELKDSIIEDFKCEMNVEIDFKDVNTATNVWLKKALEPIIKDNSLRSHISFINMTKSIEKIIFKLVG